MLSSCVSQQKNEEIDRIGGKIIYPSRLGLLQQILKDAGKEKENKNPEEEFMAEKYLRLERDSPK